MIAENYKLVEEKIAEACLNTGRMRSEIKLVAVSKTQPISAIKDGLKAGITNFGENKAQELRDKASLISSDIIWHFIGHLQSNKVKYVVGPSDLIHSVDSLKLAEEINKKTKSLSVNQEILAEINTSDEESKFGLQNEEEIFEFAESCSKLENVSLKGLMTMAPFTADEKIIRSCFIKLRNILDMLNKNGFGLSELSMGMTNDFEIAIEEGSTLLRIGSAIFGERIY